MRADWVGAGASGSQRFPQNNPSPGFNICSRCSHSPGMRCSGCTAQPNLASFSLPQDLTFTLLSLSQHFKNFDVLIFFFLFRSLGRQLLKDNISQDSSPFTSFYNIFAPFPGCSLVLGLGGDPDRDFPLRAEQQPSFILGVSTSYDSIQSLYCRCSLQNI